MEKARQNARSSRTVSAVTFDPKAVKVTRWPWGVVQVQVVPDCVDAFAQADMEDVLKETKMAFSLSIQSIWERQLRGYLRGCAEELRPGDGLAAHETAQRSWRPASTLSAKSKALPTTAPARATNSERTAKRAGPAGRQLS